MKVGQVYSGFVLNKEEYIDEVKSLCRVFEHEKTGARLVHLENEDDNKVFCITFKTPPYDDTGLPHILEHSVFCGSRKFPTKEPLVELLKSSVRTYLNAMTWPDKTMYPIASRNSKDFSNLMDVYLDVVFYPNICKEERIFMQEGWRYYIEKEEIFVNGVVYNEMKGAYASPERIIYEEVGKSLYSDTAYAFDSGGAPESILKLKFEDLVAYHKQHYHPSNSYIYLYGNGDIEEQLEFLNNRYLKNFKRISVNASVGSIKELKERKIISLKYPILESEKKKDKTYFSLSYALGEVFNKKEIVALHILTRLLLNTKSAPLKKAIMSKDLAGDVFGHLESGCLFAFVSIFLKNTNKSSLEEIELLLKKTLKKLVSEGIDKDLLEACINFEEFQLREADYGRYPKGLSYVESCLKTWLHEGDPFEYLKYKDTFNQLRRLISKGYFEELIQKYFLENTHNSLIILEPEKGLSEKKEAELANTLKLFKKGLDKKALKDLLSKTLEFKKYQERVDSPKDIKKIPGLKLDDISKKVERIPRKKERVDGVDILFNPLLTNGICYLNFAFDTGFVALEKLHALNIFSLLLGKVDTKKYTYGELDIATQKYTGGYFFKRDLFIPNRKKFQFMPKLIVSGKVFTMNTPKLMDLLTEVIFYSNFDDKKRIKEVLKEAKSRFEMSINDDGDKFVVCRLRSYMSEYGKYDEYNNGITFYHYFCDLLDNFDSKWEALRDDLYCLKESVFNRTNLAINIVCEKENFDLCKKESFKLIGNLNEKKFKREDYIFNVKNINEGLIIQSNVQYVAQGGNFKSLGFEYTGKLNVLKSILNNDYLWSNLRVKGGAYGAYCNFSRGGDTSFVSYCDPNLVETLKVYVDIPKFLENFSEKSIGKYIIGTIGVLDRPSSPAMKGFETLGMHFSNLTYKELQKEREEILSTTRKDIKGFAELLRALFKKDNFCVLGGAEKIKKNKKIFKKVVFVSK